MDFSTFLNQGLPSIADSSHSVFIIQATTFSHSFFTQLHDQIQLVTTLDVKAIDVQADEALCKAQLQTSFLGMSCIYLLGNCAGLKAKQKDDLLSYLLTYQGPHKVIVFFDAKTVIPSQDNITLITIKDRYFLQDVQSLWVSTQSPQTNAKYAQFLRQIYQYKTSYSLDELNLLKKYQDLLTGDCKDFYNSWIFRLITPESSLFTLSQLFFEKKEKEFLSLWLQMKLLYSDMFWIAFWSEQLYRAYFFIAYTQEKNSVLSKQISFGLPFSFLKQQYRQYQMDELQKAHQALYAIDIALKNGGNQYEIDQFYIVFFIGKFKH